MIILSFFFFLSFFGFFLNLLTKSNILFISYTSDIVECPLMLSNTSFICNIEEIKKANKLVLFNGNKKWHLQLGYLICLAW